MKLLPPVYFGRFARPWVLSFAVATMILPGRAAFSLTSLADPAQGATGHIGVGASSITLVAQLAEITENAETSAGETGIDELFGRSPTNFVQPQRVSGTDVFPGLAPDRAKNLRVDRWRIEGQFTTLGAAEFAALQDRITQKDGVDFLTLPRVKAASGREARMAAEDIRTIVTAVKMADPSPANSGGAIYLTDQIPVGHSFDILPELAGAGWRLQVRARTTEFKGYDEPEAKDKEAALVAAHAKNGALAEPRHVAKPLPRFLLSEAQAAALIGVGQTLAIRFPLDVRATPTGTNRIRLYAFVTVLPESEADRPNPFITERMLSLLDNDPKSPAALEAAVSMILQVPGAPEVRKAADVILQNHISGSTNLAGLCDKLSESFLNPVVAREVLQGVLEKSPAPEVQANACFALGVLLKRQAIGGTNDPAAADAEIFFKRVVSDCSRAPRWGAKLAARASAEMSELRRLRVGKEAPEIDGVDLDGRKLRLRDYRGKVVAVVFWATDCAPCMAMIPEERRLVERMAGKPFALIGVNSDGQLAKARRVAAEEKMTWPSFRDGGSFGPVATAWNIRGLPTVYVLDDKGVIRYRDLGGDAETLGDAVDTLLAEMTFPGTVLH
jgi:thiol-disulfide isomerase/thioredoxin